MQSAKDSFYMTLRERLAAVNPARVMAVNGVTRPAIVVMENESVSAAEPLANAFYIYWGGARMSKGHSGGERPLMAMECTIAYRTSGSGETGVDRGRSLTALDQELLAICRPGWQRSATTGNRQPWNWEPAWCGLQQNWERRRRWEKRRAAGGRRGRCQEQSCSGWRA